MKKVVNENQKSTLRKVLRYIRRYWGYLGASIILAAVTVALTLYLPILIGQTGSWEREPLTLPGSL